MMKRKSLAFRGFSIIELLVAVLIISFGLLGLVTLQGRAVQASVSSEDSQRAALLASEMASTMFNLNTVNLNQAVIDAWAARVADPAAGGVPNGTGTVTVINATSARLAVTWTPVHANGDANDTHTYTTDVVIPQ